MRTKIRVGLLMLGLVGLLVLGCTSSFPIIQT